MKRLNINVTDEQNERLDRMSEVTGVTKNGLICYAIYEWLMSNDYCTIRKTYLCNESHEC